MSMSFDEIMAYFPENPHVYERIKDELSQCIPMVPFVGAGLSAFSYPSWPDALLKLADAMEGDDKRKIQSLIDGKIYEEAADKLYESLGLTFQTMFQEIFKESKIDEERLKEEAAYLLPFLFESQCITTNFDKVMEYAYTAHGITPDVAYPKDVTKLNNARRGKQINLIYKVHGDLWSEPEEIIFTGESYRRHYKKGAKLVSSLMDWINSRPLLFLGCSLQTDRIMEILCSSKQNGIINYAILECDKPQIRMRKKELEQNQHIQAIYYPVKKYECVRILLQKLLEDTKPDTYKTLKGNCTCSCTMDKKPILAQVMTKERPALPSDCFLGREQLLDDIEKAFEKSRIVVLYGIGGIGKTELCRQLFERYANQAGSNMVDKIGWITYQDSLKSSFFRQFPDVPADDKKDVEEYWTRAKEYVSQLGTSFLLILDNANDISPHETALLSRLACRVLVTSRSKPERIAAIEAGRLPRESCRELYRRHSCDESAADDVIDQIIELTAGHTLSMELLAKTQLAAGLTAEELLQDLLDSGFNLSDVMEEVTYCHNPEQEKGEAWERRFIEHMAKLFDLSRIRNKPEELRILQLFSLLAPNVAVSVKTIQKWMGLKDLKSLNAVEQKGWLTRSIDQRGRSVAMHPLVSAVIRYSAMPDNDEALPLVEKVAKDLKVDVTDSLQRFPSRTGTRCSVRGIPGTRPKAGD